MCKPGLFGVMVATRLSPRRCLGVCHIETKSYSADNDLQISINPLNMQIRNYTQAYCH